MAVSCNAGQLSFENPDNILCGLFSKENNLVGEKRQYLPSSRNAQNLGMK